MGGIFISVTLGKRTKALCLAALLAAGGILFWVPRLVAERQAGAVGANPDVVPVPILMYHSILKDPKLQGQYILSPDELERDMIYLKEHGYTTVFVSELADAVLEGAPLPEKPVVLSFDDGYLNNLTYVLPLLEKHDMKAVISVVGSYSQTFSDSDDHSPAYSHLTWDDINQLAASGRVEIGNHTYDMHRQTPRKGAKKLQGESGTHYRQALLDDIGKLQQVLKEKCGFAPTTFAYPYGYISDDAESVLAEMGFTAALTCYEHISVIGSDPQELMNLGRFNRPAGISTEKFMKKVGI